LIFLIGGSHTGIRIKAQYDKIIKIFDLESKVFKVCADQGANVKKAFKLQKEALHSAKKETNYRVEDDDDEVINLAEDLLDRVKSKEINSKETKDKDDLKAKTAPCPEKLPANENLNHKTDKNQPKMTDMFNFKKLNREEILKLTAELDDVSVESDIEDENDKTSNDGYNFKLI
jgi:hypothetical protein